VLALEGTVGDFFLAEWAKHDVSFGWVKVIVVTTQVSNLDMAD
jgi:hypothetical protein